MDNVFAAVLFFGIIAVLGIFTALLAVAGVSLIIDLIREMKEKFD